MSMLNAVDISVAVLLVVGLADGARRGLSGEVATLVSTVVSGLAAWRFSGWARELILKNSSLSAMEATVAGVVVVFAAAYLVLWLLRKTISALMQFHFKGKAERLGGALSGLLRYSVFATALILLATFIPNETVQKAVAEDSVVGHFIQQRVRPLYEDLSRKHGIPLPVEKGGENLPPIKDEPVLLNPDEVPAGSTSRLPPIRDVEAAPAGVNPNEVPAGLPLGPVQ